MSNYATRLHEAVRRKRTPALVGIDPRFEQLPESIRNAPAVQNQPDPNARIAAAFEAFSRRLIDVVAPLVPAVKPQAAFFEEYGPAGCAALARVIRHARDAGLIVICDAKRGDIGSTAEAYARGYLAGADPNAAPWAADALTINPYLGLDTLMPFVRLARERGAGVYVLVRTSNPGAGTLQDRASPASAEPTAPVLPLYRHVADAVDQLAAFDADADGFGSVGAVVGATYPKELVELRAAMPHVPLLVPGYGSQGAGAADVAAAFTPAGLGALINSSRAINFAWQSEPYASTYGPTRWEDAAEAATRQMIDDLRQHTPAAVL